MGADGSFSVPADDPVGSYDRFMGRYSGPLADRLVATVAPIRGDLALDVGCGTGAVTTRLVEILGAEHLAAIDPSETFVEAVAERCPGVDVRVGTAEALPWADDAFTIALAPLVVHFMTHPVAGLREMARVTRPGGLVAATVWDHATAGAGPLSSFWDAVRSLWPGTPDESRLAGTADGDLVRILDEAGLVQVRGLRLTIAVEYASADEWWEPYTLGVGPAGAFVAGLDAGDRERLRRQCAERLPAGPFTLEASAWCAVGQVGQVGQVGSQPT